jgi:hypothetical protein
MPTSAEPRVLSGCVPHLSPISFCRTPSRGFLPDHQRLPAPSSYVGRMVEWVAPGANSGHVSRIRIRGALSLALIIQLASSGPPITAQEVAQTAPSDGQQWSRMATIMRGLKPTPSAFVWPRLVEVRRRSLAAEQLVDIAQPAQRGSSRDTLKNGAIIGAIVGAVGLGAFGAFICHLYQEEGGASCLPDTLRGAAIGAAIGTGAGVAVDAAFTRHAGVTVRIGVTF